MASGGGDVVQPDQEIALPTTATRAGQGASRQARLSGRLRVDDADCLYLSPPDSSARIGLIWPAGFTARRTADGVVEVLDGDGAVILRDGDIFRVGGGGAAGPAGHASARRFTQFFSIGGAVVREPGSRAAGIEPSA